MPSKPAVEKPFVVLAAIRSRPRSPRRSKITLVGLLSWEPCTGSLPTTPSGRLTLKVYASGGGHRLVYRCWGLSCLDRRRKYRAVRVTARSLAGEVQGLEPTVGRLGPMVAMESSVPPAFPTDGRMTLVSSWTTLCRGELGSRHGTKKDATFSKGHASPALL